MQTFQRILLNILCFLLTVSSTNDKVYLADAPTETPSSHRLTPELITFMETMNNNFANYTEKLTNAILETKAEQKKEQKPVELTLRHMRSYGAKCDNCIYCRGDGNEPCPSSLISTLHNDILNGLPYTDMSDPEKTVLTNLPYYITLDNILRRTLEDSPAISPLAWQLTHNNVLKDFYTKLNVTLLGLGVQPGQFLMMNQFMDPTRQFNNPNYNYSAPNPMMYGGASPYMMNMNMPSMNPMMLGGFNSNDPLVNLITSYEAMKYRGAPYQGYDNYPNRQSRGPGGRQAEEE